MNTDPNIAYKELSDAYTDGINLFSKSVLYKRRKTPLKPWITPSILCSINRKTNLYKKFIQKKTTQAENAYKQYRNILTLVLRDAKRLYYRSLFQEHKNDGKKTWENLKEIINKRPNINKQFPSLFTDQLGNIYKDDENSAKKTG